MAALVWPKVIREPVVREGARASDNLGLCLDLGIQGVWQPQLQVKALFDIRVIDAGAPSYRRRLPVSVLESGKRREFTVQLWRIGEETLHLLFC